MFNAALFLIARTWNQLRCPSADEQIRKLWYIYTMEYYSAIKKNTFESVLMRWMKLEPIIESEVSQKEKHQYSILMHIYGIQKDGNNNPVYETAKETLMYRKALYFNETKFYHVFLLRTMLLMSNLRILSMSWIPKLFSYVLL